MFRGLINMSSDLSVIINSFRNCEPELIMKHQWCVSKMLLYSNGSKNLEPVDGKSETRFVFMLKDQICLVYPGVHILLAVQ